MRYRNQYISTILDKEKLNFSFPIEPNYVETDLDNNINKIYKKLVINFDNLSDKIDRNFIENKESIKSIEERLTKLESPHIIGLSQNEIIQKKSKELFEKNIQILGSNEITPFFKKNDQLKNNFLSIKNGSMIYNNKWEEEFKKKGLSLKDDGIYEYENGEEDMKYEYYSGELPKTKIVKIRGNDNIQTYTKDDISEFIENESKKLALNEVSKLHNQSETTQKAWLANNQRLVELTNIIEAQEKEIRRLSQNVKNNNNFSEDDVSELINNAALKLLRDEYELRISNLEKGAGISQTDSDKKILDELRKEREENLKLKSLLDDKPVSNPKVEVVVSTASPLVNNFDNNRSQKVSLDSGRKRKQKHFFEIVEHHSPKITKADLEK